MARYVEIEAEEKRLAAEKSEIKSVLIEALGDELDGEGKAFEVHRGQTPRRTFQSARFKKENPHLYDQYSQDTFASFFKVIKKGK